MGCSEWVGAGLSGDEAERLGFVNYLYGLHARLDSEDRWRAAEARQVLARLRRSFAGPRQQAEA